MEEDDLHINVYITTKDERSSKSEVKYTHTLNIPEGYYVVTGYDEDAVNYEVYRNGKKLDSPYAVVLRKPVATIKSWKEELNF